MFKLVLGHAFAPQKTCAAMTEETGGLILEVYNFGAVAKTGRVAFTGTGRLEGLPDSVTVPPHGKTVLNLRLTAVPAGAGRIAFSGVFNGRPCSPLYAPVWQVATAPAKAFAFDRPDRWQAGPPGTLEISFDPREQAVKFVAATPEACDAVPEYALHLPAESLRGAVGVVFEIRTAATPAAPILCLPAGGRAGRRHHRRHRLSGPHDAMGHPVRLFPRRRAALFRSRPNHRPEDRPGPAQGRRRLLAAQGQSYL